MGIRMRKGHVAVMRIIKNWYIIKILTVPHALFGNDIAFRRLA